MLFLPPGKSEPVRVQGSYISTEETEQLTKWYAERAAEKEAELEEQGVVPHIEEDILEAVQAVEDAEHGVAGAAAGGPEERDALFREAAEVCITNQLGSTSLLQRKLRIGYGRAARIIDQLEEAGILGPPDGSKPREVLVGLGELDEYC
jgi:S-DNA-T family DNA segregation ATPase FtsK/SpoIIIE